MPLEHKDVHVKDFVSAVTTSFFSDIVRGCKPSDVFVAATVDQGTNVINGVKLCGIEVVVCAAHRLSSAVH